MNKAKLYALAMLTAGTTIAEAQNTPVSQMEKLTRGVVVVPAASGSGQFISWRLLGTDNDATTFDILKDGKLLKTDIFDKTNFVDKTGYTNSNYQIVTKQNGVATDTTAAVTSWGNIYMQLPLDRPEGGVTPAKETYTYSPNDCSAGDVDGDGEYEIIVKWDPSNSKDNSQSGYTGNVYLDCYKLDGTKLWRIDLGKNIRAGAHYTQFMVYDFDGDGKAEMMCKTAPGSIDGAGQYVSEAADDETIKKGEQHLRLAQHVRQSKGRSGISHRIRRIYRKSRTHCVLPSEPRAQKRCYATMGRRSEMDIQLGRPQRKNRHRIWKPRRTLFGRGGIS